MPSSFGFLRRGGWIIATCNIQGGEKKLWWLCLFLWMTIWLRFLAIRARPQQTHVKQLTRSFNNGIGTLGPAPLMTRMDDRSSGMLVGGRRSEWAVLTRIRWWDKDMGKTKTVKILPQGTYRRGRQCLEASHHALHYASAMFFRNKLPASFRQPHPGHSSSHSFHHNHPISCLSSSSSSSLPTSITPAFFHSKVNLPDNLSPVSTSRVDGNPSTRLVESGLKPIASV